MTRANPSDKPGRTPLFQKLEKEEHVKSTLLTECKSELSILLAEYPEVEANPSLRILRDALKMLDEKRFDSIGNRHIARAHVKIAHDQLERQCAQKGLTTEGEAYVLLCTEKLDNALTPKPARLSR